MTAGDHLVKFGRPGANVASEDEGNKEAACAWETRGAEGKSSNFDQYLVGFQVVRISARATVGVTFGNPPIYPTD